ncbi:MAG: nickel/cobalt transporter [Xanthobacteraceae bacterium]|jgi:nickel/cobalt transporter (NicO) family protein
MIKLRNARRIHPLVWAALAFILVLAVDDRSAWAQANLFGGPRPVAIGGIAGWVLAKQAMYYQALAGMIRLAKSNGTALWDLMGISFIYGIFHAAGPGHGKAVISSYLFANEETWRRGITLSFAAAVLQSLTAITLVGVAAVLLGATAKLMADTVSFIESVGYVLIVLIGARLLWVKGYGFFAALRKLKADTANRAAGIDGHDPALCGHGHGATDRGLLLGAATLASACAHGPVAAGEHHYHCEGDESHDDELDVLPWGHAHGPEPAELAGPDGWRRGLSAVVAVGLRPCSGAIIVLVFALAQGLFWAGIASTFVMGLGTAITVGAVATLSVAAKALAKRIVHKPTGYGALVMRGIEFGAAGFVLAFGVLLLTGYMASERMGLF